MGLQNRIKAEGGEIVGDRPKRGVGKHVEGSSVKAA
jgi:hypothetical protein